MIALEQPSGCQESPKRTASLDPAPCGVCGRTWPMHDLVMWADTLACPEGHGCAIHPLSRESVTKETPMPEIQTATVGRIVHYTLPAGRSAGQIRPGVIVRVWGPECVNLQVFTDGDNDQLDIRGVPVPAPESASSPTLWVTSAKLGPVEQQGAWHWQPRADVRATAPVAFADESGRTLGSAR